MTDAIPLRIILIVICACTVLSAQAAPTIFPACPSEFYLSYGRNGTVSFYEGAPNANGTVSFSLKSPAASLQYNATGFHQPNRYVYGLQGNGAMNNGAQAKLVRVGENGEVTNVGSINGLTDKGYSAGDMDPAGNYYVKGSGSNDIIKISGIGLVGSELTGISVSAIPLSANFISGDIAWVGDAVSGSLYSAKKSGGNNTLYRININATPVTVDNIGSFVNSSLFGALWGTPDALYGNDNDGTGFYQFDLNTGQGVKVADSIGAKSNDGARCVSNRPLFPADLSITKTNNQTIYTPGQTTQYTITATNNGPLGVVGATVIDALPTGIVTSTWTCASSAGTCAAASGSGAINTTVDLPNGANAIFVVDMNIPLSFTGSLVNTATVSVAVLGDGSPKTNLDSNATNNQATDTDTDGTVPVVVITNHEIPTLPWYGMIMMLLGFVGSYRWYFGLARRLGDCST